MAIACCYVKENAQTLKKINTFLFIIITLYGWQKASAQSQPVQIIPDEFKNNAFSYDGLEIPYRLLTPPQAKGEQKLPLIVGLHGAENFGAGKDQFLQKAGAYALGWLAPSIQEKYPCYVLAPHLYSPLFLDDDYAGWEMKKASDFLKQLIDHVVASENIDPDRIYLTGHSMGGVGTFLVPGILENYFAALVPMNTAGGSSEIHQEIDNSLYDSLSIWGVHHRRDASNAIREIFMKLESLDYEVFPTHSFGDEIIDLSPESIEQLIDEHQRYFYTEYRFPCNNGERFCHSGSMDFIIPDPLFQKWLFRQHKIDPKAIEITSVAGNSNNTINWEAKNPADSVEVWFRSDQDSRWLKLTKTIASKKTFDLVPSISRSEFTHGSKVKLVILNDKNFVYGFTESRITNLITSIPGHHNHRIITYPNPATNTVYLKMPEEVLASGLSYKIISSRGAVVNSGKIVENAIDVGGLTHGVYMMILESDTSYFREKLTIID